MTVHTDNSGQPDIKLGLEVEIPKFLAIKPSLLVWNQEDGLTTKTVKLDPEDDSVVIEVVRCDSEDFSVELVRTEDSSGCELLVAPLGLETGSHAVIRIAAQSLKEGARRRSSRMLSFAKMYNKVTSINGVFLVDRFRGNYFTSYLAQTG
ncbi:hypothetical protein [Cerasicoccus arenae]|uniref:Uncharacterized protein n=1 Tax=Cerasicoccus arenae TaxID=424488 RepID=A0A8J3DF02_9BACT|nr:hypothetical protein [Cerasicoccus arenae]MBK1860051.1 hypothetical protein [Cerasicoccus arenae]GHB93202.1 hypothetical protein GCM10007047_05610 [Cerasicoccus arenae]